MPILGVLASSISGRLGAFESISTVTVTSASQQTISFTDIPSGYGGLILRASTRNSRSLNGVGGSCRIKFNSDATTAKYYSFRIIADGSAETGSTYAGTSLGAVVFEDVSNGTTSNDFGISQITILSYSNANQLTTFNCLSGSSVSTAVVGNQMMFGGVWNDTSTVTRIDLEYSNGYSFMQHSKIALYGIKE